MPVESRSLKNSGRSGASVRDDGETWIGNEPSSESRCPDHQAEKFASRTMETQEQRKYDAAWRRLSTRARRLQRFCTRCGSTRSLPTDHSPLAWWRNAHGLLIRLRDVQVLCAAYQRELGSNRPASERYTRWASAQQRGVARVQSASAEEP